MALGALNPMTDVTGIVSQLNTSNVTMAAILALLQKGIAIQPGPRVFVVASLPTTGNTNGAFAFASNGRKAGEGAGVGTGLPVYWNAATSQWFTYANVLVTS